MLRVLKNVRWSFHARRTGLASLHILNAACALHLGAEYIGNISPMEGPSMLPTLATSGELVVEDIISHILFPSNISRGDLITFRSPLFHYRVVCKRVIGLPGDLICVDPSGLSVASTEHIIVPDGHVWVAGDNAAVSIDSRTYGPISQTLIRGKLVARIWPWRDRTIFRSPVTYVN
jgi:inner membrane protease subunit 1